MYRNFPTAPWNKTRLNTTPFCCPVFDTVQNTLIVMLRKVYIIHTLLAICHRKCTHTDGQADRQTNKRDRLTAILVYSTSGTVPALRTSAQARVRSVSLPCAVSPLCATGSLTQLCTLQLRIPPPYLPKCPLAGAFHYRSVSSPRRFTSASSVKSIINQAVAVMVQLLSASAARACRTLLEKLNAATKLQLDPEISVCDVRLQPWSWLALEPVLGTADCQQGPKRLGPGVSSKEISIHFRVYSSGEISLAGRGGSIEFL